MANRIVILLFAVASFAVFFGSDCSKSQMQMTMEDIPAPIEGVPPVDVSGCYFMDTVSGSDSCDPSFPAHRDEIAFCIFQKGADAFLYKTHCQALDPNAQDYAWKVAGNVFSYSAHYTTTSGGIQEYEVESKGYLEGDSMKYMDKTIYNSQDGMSKCVKEMAYSGKRESFRDIYNRTMSTFTCPPEFPAGVSDKGERTASSGPEEFAGGCVAGQAPGIMYCGDETCAYDDDPSQKAQPGGFQCMGSAVYQCAFGKWARYRWNVVSYPPVYYSECAKCSGGKPDFQSCGYHFMVPTISCFGDYENGEVNKYECNAQSGSGFARWECWVDEEWPLKLKCRLAGESRDPWQFICQDKGWNYCS